MMAIESSQATPPVPVADLTRIVTEACDATFKDAEGYDHAKVGDWNSQVINTILKSLIDATSVSSDSLPQYRFAVNSTIIQQGLIDKSSAVNGAVENTGKRGMHSAAGAFWDATRDGMWAFKYPGAEERGLDVVITLTWFSMS